MDEIKNRVQIELSELTTKIVKLIEFTYNDKFNTLSKDMQWLMKDQVNYMMQYADVLRRRLHIWGKTDEELSKQDRCKIC